MKIKDLFEVNKSITTSREYFNEHSGTLCVHYGDIYKYYNEKIIPSSNIINKFTLPVDSKKFIREDSIIMPDVTETISDYGHLTYIQNNNNNFYMNGTHTFAIIDKQNNNLKYLFYYLQSPKTKKRLQSLLLGSTVFQISCNDLKNFELLGYHDIVEQQHIVDTIEYLKFPLLSLLIHNFLLIFLLILLKQF